MKAAQSIKVFEEFISDEPFLNSEITFAKSRLKAFKGWKSAGGYRVQTGQTADDFMTGMHTVIISCKLYKCPRFLNPLYAKKKAHSQQAALSTGRQDHPRRPGSKKRRRLPGRHGRTGRY